MMLGVYMREKKGEGVCKRRKDMRIKLLVWLLAREGIYSFRGPAQGY